jgi:NADPH:quinone reductase-like Zn-dependent oxidoreductase
VQAVAVPRFRVSPELMDLPLPVAGPGELLVRVHFAGINPFDWKIADGVLDGYRPHVFPLILGVDAAGTVANVGAGVNRFQVGDRVVGQFLHDPVGTGTYTELTTVPQSIGVVKVPAELPLPEAAALPTAGMTALAALDALRLSRGASLLLVGASGGVGSFVTALAGPQGLRVTAVARESSSARLRAMGVADTIDPTTSEPVDALRRRHPSGFDGLIDVMSDRTGFDRYATLVRPGGTALTTTYVADLPALERSGRRGVNLDLQPNAELLGKLIRQLIEHRLPVPLERRVRLSEAPAALAELKTGRGHGKTVIELPT